MHVGKEDNSTRQNDLKNGRELEGGKVSISQPCLVWLQSQCFTHQDYVEGDGCERLWAQMNPPPTHSIPVGTKKQEKDRR